MRKPKTPVRARSLEEMYAEGERANQEARERDLVLILNSASGSDPVTGASLSSASQTRMTDMVLTIKRVAGGLALLSHQKADSHRAFDLLGELAPVEKILAGVKLRPSLGLRIDNRAITYSEILFPDPQFENRTPEQNQWKNHEGDLTVLEERAILAIGGLLRSGSIEMLRRCDCGNWYVAVRTDQKSCSTPCRQKRNAKGDIHKRQRRERYQAKKVLAAAKKGAQRHAKAAN